MATYKIQRYPIVYTSDTEVSATGAGAVGANAATLSAITGISIPVGHLVKMSVNIRKTAGFAASATFGVKINDVLVLSSAASNAPATGSQDDAAVGVFSFEFQVPGGSYVYYNTEGQAYPIDYKWMTSTAAGSTRTQFTIEGTDWPWSVRATAPIPDGPLTSLTIMGNAANAAITIASANLKIIDMG